MIGHFVCQAICRKWLNMLFEGRSKLRKRGGKERKWTLAQRCLVIDNFLELISSQQSTKDFITDFMSNFETDNDPSFNQGAKTTVQSEKSLRRPWQSA